MPVWSVCLSLRLSHVRQVLAPRCVPSPLHIITVNPASHLKPPSSLTPASMPDTPGRPDLHIHVASSYGYPHLLFASA
ncbi:hypothetical protein LY76DRAFT_593140 [Colletotrichum caudatum]|nr:hypothetical protein LY76DRAFT_593140 [Colletotrichum caudatum]